MNRLTRLFRPRWVRVTLLLVVVALVAFRIALPTLIKNYVNDRLAQLDGYRGEIGDVDVHLWRGAYSIEFVKLEQTDGDAPVPLFDCKLVDLSIYWKQLWYGALVGEVAMHEPVVNFVDAKGTGEDQTGANNDWTQVIADLFPFRIDRFEVHNGTVKLLNFDTEPQVKVYISECNAVALNLTNSLDVSKTLMAEIRATGKAMGESDIELDISMNPFAAEPTFDLNATLDTLDLKEIAPLIAAYAPFDVEDGEFLLALEIACDQGVVSGYAKPLFRKLKVLTWKQDVEEDKDNPLQLFWEALVGATGEVLENQEEDQFATKIPLKGEFDRLETDLFAAIPGVLKNAFVRAFMPTVDDEVTLADAQKEKRENGDEKAQAEDEKKDGKNVFEEIGEGLSDVGKGIEDALDGDEKEDAAQDKPAELRKDEADD